MSEVDQKLAKIRILVVDDDEMVCESIVDLFEMIGVDVKGVLDAKSALALIEQEEFGIVISDIKMPGEDGFWLLNEIKKRNQAFPKVLFISGHEQDVEKCYALGVEGFFSKPFSLAEVKKAIVRCFLRNEDSLRKAAPSTQGRITKKFYDWEELEKSGEVGFGNRGVFFTDNVQNVELNQLCSFSIQFLSSSPIRKLEGQGIVRWIRTAEDQDGRPMGVGVEVTYLEKQGLPLFLDYIENLSTISTIPRDALTKK